VNKLFAHSARIKRLRGKALSEENGFLKINNTAYKPFKIALRELVRGNITAADMLNVEQLY